MRDKLTNISNTEFKNIVKNSKYIKDVLLKCGYKATNNKRSRDKIKKRIEELNIDISHFKYTHPKTLKQICIQNSNVCNKYSTCLKRRLLKEKIFEDKCCICKMGNVWNNKPIQLQLDHINGNNKDNRIENLRILCPNCHSQTSTFSGKNNKKLF